MADIEQRVIEVETTLFGAKRNGGGFIKETRETMEVIRKGVNTLSQDTRDLRAAIDSLKGSGWRLVARFVVPPLVTGGLAVIAVVLTR